MEALYYQMINDILIIEIAGLVTEVALGRLKIKFWVLYRKCESNKNILKLYTLACVVLYNLCIEHGDLVPRKFHLTLDHASNRSLSQGEVMDVLALGSTNQKNFEVNKKSQALKIWKALTAKMWKEKKDYLWIQIQHSLMFFHFRTEIHDAYYYITVNVTILYYSNTCVQYLDVQRK